MTADEARLMIGAGHAAVICLHNHRRYHCTIESVADQTVTVTLYKGRQIPVIPDQLEMAYTYLDESPTLRAMLQGRIAWP